MIRRPEKDAGAKQKHWTRLDPERPTKTSKLGRLTAVKEAPPEFLLPLGAQYEKVTTVVSMRDDKTGLVRSVKKTEPRRDENGDKIPKEPKRWAIGGWDIESHCYDHTCSEAHQHASRSHPKCPQCEACPACNPAHGDHWVAAQLSVLRIPDAYVDYVKNLDESRLMGGTRREGGRYVEFLNDPGLSPLPERARCIAPGGCVDKTLRFLMSQPCFMQRARPSRGYFIKNAHKPKCLVRGKKKEDGTDCPGCVKEPICPGEHTPTCRWQRGGMRKDGKPCKGCSTLGTAWYSHFGGGYDINFALRWLSSHTPDSSAVKQAVMSTPDGAERESMRKAFEKRYEYKAESLLSGATHIQVKLCRLHEVYKRPKPKPRQSRANLASQLRASIEKHTPTPAPARTSDGERWTRALLSRGLTHSGEVLELRAAQQHLSILLGRKIKQTGHLDPKTRQALSDFQRGAGLPQTGKIDRETSAAMILVRSRTELDTDPDEVILLRDSFRLVGSSLAEAAKDFDLKHPDSNAPLRKIDDIDVEDPPPPDDDRYREYCRLDTEICVQLVATFEKLIRELGGTLEMTSSACAVSLFRRRFLQDKVQRQRHLPGCRALCPDCGLEACHQACGKKKGKKAGENIARHKALLRRYKKNPHKLCSTYPVGCFHFSAIGHNGHRHGGHVEVLRETLPLGRCYDVNSLYPFAMLGPVPVGSAQRFVNLTPEQAQKEKRDSPLRRMDHNWRLQRQKTRQLATRDRYWRDLVRQHGEDMATLEMLIRVGADHDKDDPNFERIDAFRRFKRCGYIEAVVSIPRNDDAPECYFPPLPLVRDSRDGEEILFWPTGDGIYGWWCYEELRAILQVPGARLVAMKQCIWMRGEPLFREFIETLYKRRQESDGAMKQLLKILMNGTYGKTLQNPLKRKVMRLQPAQRRPKGWLPTNPDPPSGDVFLWPWGTVQEYQEAPFFLPQWGSLITARARMVLWHLVVDVERGRHGKGNFVAYADTDSLYTTAKIDSDPKLLGALKLEYELTDDKRKKIMNELDVSLSKYRQRRAEEEAAIHSDTSLNATERKARLERLEKRSRYWEEEHYRSKLDSSKHRRPRPTGLISCELHGPKLYIVKDPDTGDEVKAVHKGSPEPNADKLRRFIAGEALVVPPRAPKAGIGIRDDFKFEPVSLTRTGQKNLWRAPERTEHEIEHKRVHHHDPTKKGLGTTSPRFVSAHDAFILESSFRDRRRTTAAAIFEEWTGEAWPTAPTATLAVASTASADRTA